jgi:hypothetical protein
MFKCILKNIFPSYFKKEDPIIFPSAESTSEMTIGSGEFIAIPSGSKLKDVTFFIPTKPKRKAKLKEISKKRIKSKGPLDIKIHPSYIHKGNNKYTQVASLIKSGKSIADATKEVGISQSYYYLLKRKDNNNSYTLN